MDVLEAIDTRRSIRAYLPGAVPEETLRKLMELALRAPSWGNTQPWEFSVVAGKKLEALKQELVAEAQRGTPPGFDMPTPAFPDRYRERSRDNGRRLYEVLGIAREDREARVQFSLHMSRFFGAPAGLIIYIDRELTAWSLIDVGLVMQTIMLAALGLGLGACPEAAVVSYPNVLRSHLGIPESKQIVCGMALGYPDPEAPLNRFRSQREPLNEVVRWHLD